MARIIRWRRPHLILSRPLFSSLWHLSVQCFHHPVCCVQTFTYVEVMTSELEYVKRFHFLSHYSRVISTALLTSMNIIHLCSSPTLSILSSCSLRMSSLGTHRQDGCTPHSTHQIDGYTTTAALTPTHLDSEYFSIHKPT
ncbi:hypothetical protein CC86DRAFT_190320 [Ophiobolus disseminans]|uniref:Uncharacterized protein n=1 Tax=Ophiobolus disseminans TaxID=1469910 RepID=A0A6A7A9Q9_9PLEO|nr:hypothetical protein CC86DRAFT_190320 [Ophiobolus disseminans]